MSGELPGLAHALAELSQTLGVVVVDTPTDRAGNPIIDEQVIYDFAEQGFNTNFFTLAGAMPRTIIIEP